MPLIINTLVGWFGIFALILTLVPTTPSTLTIGRLRVGRLETHVNSGLAGSPFGEAHFTRDSGQVLRRVLWRGYGCGYSVTELLFVATLQKAPPILCAGGDSAGGASFPRAAGWKGYYSFSFTVYRVAVCVFGM